MNTTFRRNRIFPSVDLIAALRHDRRTANAEGFPRVAQRADAHIEWLEATLDEMAKMNGGDVNLKVEISVSVSF